MGAPPNTQPKRCLTCGYILDHLAEPRCPECGREFDSASPWTYAGPRQSCTPLLVATLCATVFCAAPLLTYRLLPLVAVGLPIHLWVVVAVPRLLAQPRTAVVHRLPGVAAMIVSGLALFAACLYSILLLRWPGSC